MYIEYLYNIVYIYNIILYYKNCIDMFVWKNWMTDDWI